MPAMTEQTQPMQHEELADRIYNVESHETPMLRMMRRNRKVPNQFLHSWPVEGNARSSLDGNMDNTDFTEFDSETREEIQNYCMTQSETWMVSYHATLTNAAGVGRKEKAHQVMKAMRRLKLKMERTILSDLVSQAESGAANPYRTRGGFEWVQAGAQTNVPVPENFRPHTNQIYTGALSSFRPANMETMMVSAAEALLKPVNWLAVVGIRLKQQMSDWAEHDDTVSANNAALTRYNLNKNDKALLDCIDFFTFDAGKITAIANYNILCNTETGAASDSTTRSGLFIDRDELWELRFMKDIHSAELPDLGAGPRGYCRVTWGTACMNPLGQGAVNTSS